MATQSMQRRKEEAKGSTKGYTDYSDYEDGKPRDKKQKKLKEWIGEDENNQ